MLLCALYPSEVDKQAHVPVVCEHKRTVVKKPYDIKHAHVSSVRTTSTTTSFFKLILSQIMHDFPESKEWSDLTRERK